MNTTLLRRILDKARDDAATRSDAMAIEDLMHEVEDAHAALNKHDAADWQEADGLMAALKALAAHVRAQPFDVVQNEETEQGVSVISDAVEGGFADWLAELERLAQ